MEMRDKCKQRNIWRDESCLSTQQQKQNNEKLRQHAANSLPREICDLKLPTCILILMLAHTAQLSQEEAFRPCERVFFSLKFSVSTLADDNDSLPKCSSFGIAAAVVLIFLWFIFNALSNFSFSCFICHSLSSSDSLTLSRCTSWCFIFYVCDEV